MRTTDDTDPTEATVDERRAGSDSASPPLKLTGSRYRLGESIGRGGMGEVLVAHDEQIGRDVAIKRMLADAPSDRATLRFMREARIQGRLDHPAIVPVHELGRDVDGRPYFAMKKLVGTTLGDTLADAELARAARPRLLRAFADVCLAVEFAHVRGVIHRDLKPDNIALGDYGEVYVLDWGVAKVVGEHDEPFDDAASGPLVTMVGSVVGTKAYMPPEQAGGTIEVDARADVYALGRTLVEILGDDVPPELGAACTRATAADRDARFATARELAEVVQRYVDGDRDLALRRRLAADHLERARAAIDEPDGRRDAMRDAARALALEPQLDGAAELVGRLMLEPPRDTPPEVTAAIAADELAAARRSARSVMAAQFVYVVMLPSLIMASATGLLVALIAATGVNIALSAVATRMANIAPPWRAIVSNAIAVAVIGRIYSPLIVAPAVTGLMAMTLSLNPSITRGRTAALLIVALALGLIAPFALELAGAIEPTMTFASGTVTVVAPGLTASRPIQIALMVVFFVVVPLYGVLIATGMRSAVAAAQRRLHLQAWQLQQLIPERA